MKKVMILTCFLAGLTAVVQAQTDSARYFFELGMKAKEERRYAVAEKAFNQSLKYKTNDFQTQLQLGSTYFLMNKYQQSRSAYNEVIKVDKDNPEAIEKLAVLNFNLRTWPEAALYGKKALALRMGTDMHYMVGKAFYGLEDYGQAIRHLEIAFKEDPKKADAAYTIAQCYEDMSNYKMAAPYYVKAIDADTTKYGWVYELGMVYATLGDNANAVKYMEMAGARGMKMDNDYFENLSYAYMNLGKMDIAIEKLKIILAKKPGDLNILYAVGEAYYAKGKFKDAIEYWDQILFYDKENARALYMIGMAYQRKGDKDKGMALCDRAIQMDPSLASLKQTRQGIGM
jgi:tetratricopeptide (TPR) repeat protein